MLKEYRIEEGYRCTVGNKNIDKLSTLYTVDGRMVRREYRILSSSFNRCPVCGNITIGNCRNKCEEEYSLISLEEFKKILDLEV